MLKASTWELVLRAEVYSYVVDSQYQIKDFDIANTHEPLVAQTASVKLPEEVRLKTNDGWTIVGDLYMPSGLARGAVVLLHQRSGSAYDWGD